MNVHELYIYFFKTDCISIVFPGKIRIAFSRKLLLAQHNA